MRCPLHNPATEAIESYNRWLNAFNNRDVNGMLDEMHFPHVRITGESQIQMWKSRADHLIQLENMTDRLRAEGWRKTTTANLEAVQHGTKKVHLVMRQSRINSQGTSYNIFDTLLIFTEEEKRWVVRFRSSFQLGSSEVCSQSIT